MDRFDKFTDHARAVLTLAQDEAQRFRHPYIGTEHLLLGLLRVDDCMATRVLRNLGAEPSKVRAAVEFIIGRGDLPVVGEVGLTPRAKRVIELAIDEARRMDHHYIGTEHLLLGIVREGEGIAAGVLESLRVNLDKVRHEVIRLLAETSLADPSGRNVAPMTVVSAPMTVVSAPIPVDEANRTLEISRWYVDIGASPLRRVVGIGQVARDAGVSVELIALEIREAGCVLCWKAHPDQERPLGEPQFAVNDDAGTDYGVRPAGRTGNGREMKGEALVVPEPPEEATTMRVELTGFAAPRFPPMGSEDVRGTWHFEFAIRG
jgi:Clp amino terminal domain, pathogenicity island component